MIDIRKVFYSILLVATLIISYYLTTGIYNTVNNEKNITNIAVLNGIKLKEQAKCFKLHDINSEKLNNMLREINRYETQIRNEYNTIQNNNELSAKQKQNKINKLQSDWKQKYVQYNQEIQNIRESDKKLTDYIYDKLNKILKSTAKEINIDLILNKETSDTIFVFYNKSTIDITDAIILKLDEETKYLNIK